MLLVHSLIDSISSAKMERSLIKVGAAREFSVPEMTAALEKIIEKKLTKVFLDNLPLNPEFLINKGYGNIYLQRWPKTGPIPY